MFRRFGDFAAATGGLLLGEGGTQRSGGPIETPEKNETTQMQSKSKEPPQVEKDRRSGDRLRLREKTENTTKSPIPLKGHS